MKRLSVERRRVVALSGSVAAMSGIGPVLLRGTHVWLRWAWMSMVMVLCVWVIVLFVRLRRKEGCV